MSIIHDALKKTQQSLQKNKPRANLINNLSLVRPEQKKINTHQQKNYTQLILMCTILLVILLYFLNTRRPNNSSATLLPNKIPSIPLNIHGVLLSPSGNTALIDDQVYEEGDTIKEFKILKINPHAITLLKDNKEQIITVK